MNQKLLFGILSGMMLLVACGEDSSNDNVPNILTGATGIIVLLIVIWLVAKAVRK